MESTMTIEPWVTRRAEVTPEGRKHEDRLSAPRLQTYCDAATSFREKDTPAATGRLDLQRHLESDVLLACAATRSRSRRSGRGRKLRLRRQRVRNDAATSHPSGSTGPANSYTVHSTLKHPTRCTERTNHHDVRNLSAARRLVASDAGNQSNTTSKHVASSRVGALCQGVGWSLREGCR